MRRVRPLGTLFILVKMVFGYFETFFVTLYEITSNENTPRMWGFLTHLAKEKK